MQSPYYLIDENRLLDNLKNTAKGSSLFSYNLQATSNPPQALHTHHPVPNPRYAGCTWAIF
jgi:hypothetical protein